MDEKAFKIMALDVELLTRGLQDALSRIANLEERLNNLSCVCEKSYRQLEDALDDMRKTPGSS